MKRTITLLVFMTVLAISACAQDVYVGGWAQIGSPKAVVWKNGEVLYQHGGRNGNYDAFITSIFVSGDDVYYAGYETASGSDYSLMVWKNGELLYTDQSANDSEVLTLCVDGDDLYYAGSYDYGAVVWKNGNKIYSSTPNDSQQQAKITSMVVNKGDYYTSMIVGSKNNWLEPCSYIEKNGRSLYVYNYAIIKSMAIDFGRFSPNYYATGYELSSSYKYYKTFRNDGEMIDHWGGVINSEGTGIVITPSGEWATCFNRDKESYYKQADSYSMILTKDGHAKSVVNSICGYENDIYTAGLVAEMYVGDAVYWKNDENIHYLNTPGAQYSEASCIFVKGSSVDIESLDTDGFEVYTSDKSIVVKSESEEELARVYNVAGSLLKKQALQKGETIISGLNTGIYIVKVGTQTRKVVLN